MMMSKTGLLGGNKSIPNTLFSKRKMSEYLQSSAKLHSKANAPTDYTSMPGAQTQLKKDDDTHELSSIANTQGTGPDVDGFSKVEKYGKNGERRNEKGQMLDSDGFAMVDLDEMDTNEMTLEEKILCGFFTAKPTNKEQYPTALNSFHQSE